MALKTLKKCEECKNDCKIMVDSKLCDKMELIACPKGKKFKQV